MENSQKKILVVDDDEILREMHTMVLEDEGYQVDSAATGNEAWELLNTHHYDLIATDMFMPEMNGFELIQKCIKQFPTLKTILVSGGGKDLSTGQEGKLASFKGQDIKIDLFLIKPFDLDEMLSDVSKLLQE